LGTITQPVLGKFPIQVKISMAISNSVLPDGRIFGSITQKRPQKMSCSDKIGGREITKFDRKRQNNLATVDLEESFSQVLATWHLILI
jgi:hypothetical protein